ncbi:MAG: DUF4335 domain-containing protein [Cyanobacteria bacterium P01_G01_bin.39]
MKRQYILPNCNLILEGLEDPDAENADILSGQIPMSTLINAECHLLNSNQKLSGGSVFLKNLARTVSNYAQGLLSGLFQSEGEVMEYPQISLHKVEDKRTHRLSLEPDPNSGESSISVDLTTVELFDLVDAIDQFYADPQTLPQMTLELKPVSKRYRKPEQPLTERLTPVVIGFSSLAIAAGAIFMIPTPETAPPSSAPITPATETETENIPSATPEAESDATESN